MTIKTGWTLGPAHRNYGAALELGPSPRPTTPRPRSTYAKPKGFRCSQCGADKPAARSHCPCGAFQKTTTPTGEAGAAVMPTPSLAVPADPDPLVAIRDRMNAKLAARKRTTTKNAGCVIRGIRISPLGWARVSPEVRARIEEERA